MVNKTPDEQLAIDREIDAVAHLFEQSLRRGDALSIEEVLARHDSLKSGLVRELVWAEIGFRQSQHDSIDWQAYEERFPSERQRLQEASAAERLHKSIETSGQSIQDSVVDTPKPSPEKPVEPPIAPLDLSDYQLQRSLGRGGQGEVHLARQISLGRPVAIKFVNPKGGGDSTSIQRFLREARILAQTQHPHIVTIHGIGKSGSEQLFLVMEFVEGVDLARQIKTKSIPVNEAVQIAIKIGHAIEHAHRRGVIHRDLKPSNVLWDEFRGPVVTDFGLAKDLRSIDQLTLTEQMMGTPAYMAPEQADRRYGEISEKTDIYGMAAILYALLTRKAPYGPGSLAEVLHQLTSANPPPDPCQIRPEVPASLSRLCRKGLAKDPQSRFETAHDFVVELQKWAATSPASHEIALPETVISPSPESDDARLEVGSKFGRFRLVAELSSDQTRKIFRAEDESGQPVLVKCLPEAWLTDRLRRFQFRQEVMLSSSIKHPCLAEMIEAGVIGKNEFLALRLVDGQSVAQLIARHGPYSEAGAIRILQPIAEAMHLIHGAGIIYRDLRPQNIVVLDDGKPMLAEVRFSDELEVNDNVTMAGVGSVTSQYVAPEILLGRSSDVVSDVYTLGATLFTMLTGEEPFADAADILALLMQKNAGQLISSLRQTNSRLSPAILDLLDASMKPNPAQRIASAELFAERLTRSIRPAIQKVVPVEARNRDASDGEFNLLHTVWDKLDPELQDAFSLAFNKKRRMGSTRISTKDLFEALGRLGTGPLKQVMSNLPPGAMPEPLDGNVPIDKSVLREDPQLSDCVHDSLTQFQKLERVSPKIAPIDLFVDVAKHGHGASVVRLREHGVDSQAIERIVQKLGLKVVRREALMSKKGAPVRNEPIEIDDNVQFTLYRPKVIRPNEWEPFLAFAHLSDLAADAPAGSKNPIAEVRRQAEQALGALSSGFQSLTTDSAQSIARSSELVFVPSGQGLEFNPPQRAFLWKESVHREEFRVRADSSMNGQSVQGRLSIYLGRLLIAEVSFVIRIDQSAAVAVDHQMTTENRARPFRMIYACVSKEEEGITKEFQQAAALLKDRFVTSATASRSGESSIEQRQQLIELADIFQLFWSHRAVGLPDQVWEADWRHALSLDRTDFVRPIYWEEPFPTNPDRSLPPAELLAVGFQKISPPLESKTISFKASYDRRSPIEESPSTESLLGKVLSASGEENERVHHVFQKIRPARSVGSAPSGSEIAVSEPDDPIPASSIDLKSPRGGSKARPLAAEGRTSNLRWIAIVIGLIVAIALVWGLILLFESPLSKNVVD